MNQSPIDVVTQLKRELKVAISDVCTEQNLLNDHSLEIHERVRIANTVSDLADTRDFIKQKLEVAEHYAVNDGSPLF